MSTHAKTALSIGWPDASLRFHAIKTACEEDAALQAALMASETNLSAEEKATKVVWVVRSPRN